MRKNGIGKTTAAFGIVLTFVFGAFAPAVGSVGKNGEPVTSSSVVSKGGEVSLIDSVGIRYDTLVNRYLQTAIVGVVSVAFNSPLLNQLREFFTGQEKSNDGGARDLGVNQIDDDKISQGQDTDLVDVHVPSSFHSVGNKETNTYNINLRKFWNLVSLPFNETKAKTSISVRYNSIIYSWIDAVNGGIILDTFYDWDRIGQIYLTSDSLTPGRGYWAWAYYDCDLILTSSKIEDARLSDLQIAWNIIGLPVNTSLAKQTLLVRYNNVDYTWAQATTNDNPTGGPIILGFIYGWNRIDQMYLLSDTFNPGNGYWMYAYQNCILKKGG